MHTPFPYYGAVGCILNPHPETRQIREGRKRLEAAFLPAEQPEVECNAPDTGLVIGVQFNLLSGQ